MTNTLGEHHARLRPTGCLNGAPDLTRSVVITRLIEVDRSFHSSSRRVQSHEWSRGIGRVLLDVLGLFVTDAAIEGRCAFDWPRLDGHLRLA